MFVLRENGALEDVGVEVAPGRDDKKVPAVPRFKLDDLLTGVPSSESGISTIFSVIFQRLKLS